MVNLKYCQCTFKIFCLILTINLVLVQSIKNENVTGTIRNLSVSVFQDNAFNDSGIFKFNISWLSPLSGRVPTSYSIIISSISNEETEKENSCPKESLYYTTQNENEFQVILPKRKFLTQLSEFSIHLKCSYKIQIVANPRTNLLQNPSIVFTVPDCIGFTCNCQKLQKNLSAIEVKTNFLSNGDIFIKWKPYSSEFKVDFYSISIGVPLLMSKNGLPVFKKTQIIKLPSLNFSFLWKREQNINYNVSSDSIIFVSAQDNRECEVNIGNSSIELFKQGNTRANLIYLLLAIISVITILIGLLVFLNLRSKKAYNDILFDKKLAQQGTGRFDLLLRNHNILYVDHENDKMSMKLKDEKYEINYDDIEIKKELGRGQFGKVFLAKLKSEQILVAVKISSSDVVHEKEAKKQLLEEIEIIKAAGPHPHLVSLVGFSMTDKNPICLVLEYMEGGDLLSYLRSLRNKETSFEIKYSNIFNHRPFVTQTVEFGKATLPLLCNENHSDSINSEKFKKNISIKTQGMNEIEFNSKFVERNQFLHFSLQIALGMEHLESKDIIHRDLAARNILIDSNFNLKISDFGLSRNGVYVMGNGMGVRRLPIRWMSPEALRERAFSSKSDVWSYSVVLWEIGTLGMFPYSNVQDDDLLKYILSDNSRLPKPENVESDIYNIMNMCWASKPEQRPSFQKLVSLFSFLTKHNCSSDDFGKSNPCYSLMSSSYQTLLE